MKNTFLLAALGLVVITSCKKNNSGSNSYHVTATIDGKAQTFNVSTLATRVSNAGFSVIAIEGFNGTNSSNTQALSIGWTNNAPNKPVFGPGTWSDTSKAYGTIGTYVLSSSEQYVGGSGVTGASNLSGLNHLKIVITSMDSLTVKGTFSGDFYFMGDITGAKKSITNGDFYVAWKK